MYRGSDHKPKEGHTPLSEILSAIIQEGKIHIVINRINCSTEISVLNDFII